ncbi:hypothetical protein [uncultured Pseudomonas sp.]|uniref:phage tail tube protein n=1 Tax=uncultured Pseudomonas sp. TaxID=114707 RepID=UPI0030D79FED|tara:strand:- start:7747 stop:8490 length:744 start_codon:yes stop_codon:yes gene_type:complete
MAQVDRSFVGEGIIYARAYQSQAALLDIGNCDAFNLSYQTNRTTLPNFRGGGGNRNVRERITDVTASIGMYDLTPENVARVTRSLVTEVPTTAIVDEPLACEGLVGELIPFKYLPNMTPAPVLKTAGDDPLVAGTDYLLNPHGIIVTSTTNITSAGVKASYTPRGSSVLQMMTAPAVELEIYIAGLNDAQSGEPFSLRPRRVKLGVVSQLQVLGQEYLKLEAPGELLADDTVVASDISKFCAMELAA